MSDPSEAAIQAAQQAAFPNDKFMSPHPAVLRAAKAAHDPALGLDRSVCLRDIVEFVAATMNEHLAHAINCRFGGGER